MQRRLGAALLGTVTCLALLAFVPGASAASGPAAGIDGDYVWVDSVAGASVYDWEVGATTVTPGSNAWLQLSSTDSMDFTFYGQQVDIGSQTYLAEDGVFAFGSTAPTGPTTEITVLPDTAAPNVMAPFWVDMDIGCDTYVYSDGGSTSTGNTGQERIAHGYTDADGHPRWIISYQDIPLLQNSVYNNQPKCEYHNTFGAKLFEGSDIFEYQYLWADNGYVTGTAGTGGGASKETSVGIENATGSDGISYFYTGAGSGVNPEYAEFGLRWFVNDLDNAVDSTVVVDQDSLDNQIRVSNNDDPVLYHSLTGPSDGTLAGFPTDTVYGAETFVAYTPDAAFYGNDSFEYKVDDGYDEQVTANKTIHVNAPPVGVDDAFVVQQDDPETFLNVTANDSDPFYSTWSGPSTAPAVRVVGVGTTTLGAITVSANGTGLDFTPGAGLYGKETTSYTLSDGRINRTVSLTIEVERAIMDPVMTTNGTVEMLAGETIVINETILSTIDPVHPAAQLVYRIVTMPSAGTLTLDGQPLAAGATFTQADVDAELLAFASTVAQTTTLEVQATNPDALSTRGIVTLIVHPVVPPQAAIAVGAGPHYTKLPIRLADASTPGSFPIASYEWTFTNADGVTVQTSTGRVGQFTTMQLGEYTARLVVTDAAGQSDATEVDLAVTITYTKGTPYFLVSDAAPAPGQKVYFTDASERGSYELVAREWTFEDGDVPKVDAIVEHVFAAPGDYKVTLRIVDKGGNEYFHTETIYVRSEDAEETSGVTIAQLKGIGNLSRAPIADAGPDQVVLQGSVVQLDGAGSRPTATAGDLQYAWSHVSGVAVPMAGADTPTPRISVPFLHEPEAESVLQLIVTDAAGVPSAPDRVRLVMRDSGTPSISAIPPPSADFAFTPSLTGNVSFTAGDLPGPGVRYVWDFDDGTVEQSVDPEVRHRFPGSGVYQVRLRVEDDFGRVAEYQRAVVLQDAALEPDADGVATEAKRPPVHAEDGGWALGLLAFIVVVSAAAVAGAGWLIVQRRRR